MIGKLYWILPVLLLSSGALAGPPVQALDLQPLWRTCEQGYGTFEKAWDRLELTVHKRLQSGAKAAVDTHAIALAFFPYYLPDEDPEKLASSVCAVLIKELHGEGFKKKDLAKTRQYLTEWKSCLFTNYRDVVPAEIQALSQCYNKLLNNKY